MNEYRTEIPLDDADRYVWVLMLGIPGFPDRHKQSKPSKYPFPTPEAAERFAYAHSDAYPGRPVIVEYPNGNRLELGDR